MTPAEQDKELREKLNSLFESVFAQGMRAGKDVATETYEDFDAWHKKGETDEIMQLIIADRKRVALEARIDELEHLDDQSIGTEWKANRWFSAYDRMFELKAQQEELEYS